MDEDLTTEIVLALDNQLITCYQSWFSVYGELKPETEREFLSAVYSHYRLAYALGFKDGIDQGRTDELNPLLKAVEDSSEIYG